MAQPSASTSASSQIYDVFLNHRGAMAQPSACTSASSQIYDVFLNHRGADVKKTLASHIYRRLLSYGLQVFLDQPELQQGETLTPQIERAIASASVQVAIFSPRYAQSRWCLDELVLMLESKKKSGATIIPVFYKVQPSDLRWTDKAKNNDRVSAQALTILQETGRYGVFAHALRILRWTGKDTVYVQALKNIRWTGSDRVYAQALLTHEKRRRYDKETLAAWRKALAEVSYISGFELESCNCDEGELVDKVVQQVLRKVKIPPLHVAGHPTGLDNKLEDFEKKVLLQQQYNWQARVVGIVGLGGVGKTTMAKEFFNRKRSGYDRSCFLPEVREAAARSSLTSLQSKLYEDLTGKAAVMHSVDEGTGMLRRPLSCSQVLIILDDIDHVDQLLAFVSPGNDVLQSGSLIIVTSRNKEVFTILGIGMSSIYNMTGLDEEHSQLLFCLHAFNQRFPVVEFEEVVGKFLELCAGLPLSLKVFGRLLRGKKDLEHWEAQLRKIFKSGLPTDIQSRLRISYDSLEEEEKKIFVDIACFFIEIKKDTAIRIWDGSGWVGRMGLQNLEYKSLVEIDSENRLRMHDQLRDLGRDLAAKEPLGCGLRLWRPADSLFCNVPPQSTVRGIMMVEERYGELLFQTPVDMSRLLMLIAPGHCLESIFEMLREPDLLWLRVWHIYPYSRLPSSIPIKNLRVLELGASHQSWETLWETESEAPLQLRELIIRGKLLRLPRSIGQLKHLEMIELYHFIGSSLPEEFFHLSSLKHLKLKLKASEMMSLPDSFGNLSNLQHIDLSGCSYLQTLPPSFGNLTNLQHVNLEFCVMLKMLPECFRYFTKLQHVNLTNCWTLKKLPESFRYLIRLKYLNLTGCSELTPSPITLGNFSTLERLNFYQFHNIEVLPPQVTHQRSLVELFLGCRVKALPSAIGDLGNLKILRLNCPLLEALPRALGNLTNLESFQIINCSRLKCLPDTVGELQQLISLSIVDTGIEYLPAGVRELNYLEDLTVMDCPIREVPFASVEKVQGGRRLLDSSRDKLLLRLRRLTLWSTRITEISFGEGVCPNLQKLTLHSCDELVEVGALPTTLTSLSMRYCGALNRITALSRIGYLPVGVRELNNLEELTVGDCPISEVSFANVEKVQGGRRLLDSSIHKCMLRLKRLELVKTRLTEISFGEGVCPNLQQLTVHSCHDLVEVGALPTTLTSLDMRGCGALNRITGFSGTEYLPAVGVSKLNNLEVLGVHDCPIREVPFAIVEKVQKGRRWLDSSIQERMFGLRRLELVKTRITEISFGEGVCPNLQTLNLRYCHDLQEIGAFPTTLTSLDMRGCGALKKITGLFGLAKLLELGMRRCKEVKVLPDLQTLISMETVISLEWVGISKCDKMKSIRVLLQAADPESHIFEKLIEKLIELAEESKEEDYFQEDSEAEEN